jgi:hypothetical protein
MGNEERAGEDAGDAPKRAHRVVTVGVGAIVRCCHERIKAAAATREIHPCAPHAAGDDSPCMAGVDLEQHGGFAVEPFVGGWWWGEVSRVRWHGVESRQLVGHRGGQSTYG